MTRGGVRLASRLLWLLAAALCAAIGLYVDAFLGRVREAAAARCAAGADGADAPRIVSLVPSATEMLFALGLGSNVVGRSSFCDWPPEARARPVAGDLLALGEDAFTAMRPTHVVLNRADAPQAALARALGAEIVVGRAQTAADVLAFADALGDRFPALTNGFAAAGSPWRAAMEALAAAPAPVPGATGALAVVSHAADPWSDCFAAGAGTFHDELLRAAGFSNVLSSADGYPVLDPDRILALAPAVVFDLRPDGPADPAADAAFWSFLPAGTDFRVLRDTATLRPGPRLPEVLARLAPAP